MPSKLSALRNSLRRAAFDSTAKILQVDPSGLGERRFHGLLINKLRSNPEQLQSLAWHAEERGDLVLALQAWQALIPQRGAPKREGKAAVPVTKIFGKLAAIETRMRRQVAFFAKDEVSALAGAPGVVLTEGRFDGQARPSKRSLRMQRALLAEFWPAVGALSEAHQARLRKAYSALASHRNRARRQHIALSALQPVLALWPDYQTAYALYYKAVLQMVQDDLEQGEENGAGWAIQESWWAFFQTRQNVMNQLTLGQIWRLSLRFANKLQDDGHMQAAERIMLPAFKTWDDNSVALVVLARSAEARRDWRTAVGHWQLYAAITNPVSTKSGTIRADNADDRIRKTNFARSQLRAARAELALECHGGGRRREFRELAARIIESLPDQRMMKYDTRLLEVTRLYVQDALREDGIVPSASGSVKLRRVALCLDILKLSDVHTHSRVIFTMCRNMLRHDPDLRMDIIITNERFAVTTPIISPSFNPTRNTNIEERARAAMGDLYGTRFHLHMLGGTGLEGVVDSCKHILDLEPDLVLYGGGHRGLFSNESRLVRHALFEYLPAAFFYIQANNEVDARFDMIIARGPHAIEGEPGDVPVRVQPYPTIVEEALSAAQTAVDPAKADSKMIVSAITGVRMDVLLKDMQGADAKGFFSILDRVPGTVWHFIGCTDVAAVKAANPVLARRVKAGQVRLHTVMPFEEFTTLVSGAALFLHLPGFTGGSGGAAVARRGAVPILTFNHSDVSGRQPPETIFDTADVAGFSDMAVRLLQNRSEWCRIAERQIAHTDWIRETSVQGFHDCLTEATDLGRRRLGTASADPAHRIVQKANG